MPVTIAFSLPPAGGYRLAEAESCEAFYTNGWHKHGHENWVINVADRPGKGRIDGQLFDREENSIGIFAPHKIYEEFTPYGKLISWSWLILEEMNKEGLLDSWVGSKRFAIVADPTGRLRNIIREITTLSVHKPPGVALLVTGLLYKAFGTIEMLRTQAPVEAEGVVPGVAPMHPWRRIVLAALDKNHAEPPSADEIAAELAISVSSFTHRYREECGESFRETVHRWRVEKIRTLLEASSFSIKEIATQVGFANSNYLSTYFKRMTGYNPTEYREKIPGSFNG